MIRKIHFTVLAIISFSLLLAGCGTAEKTPEEVRELVVLCGSSFVPPSEEVFRQFKAETGVEILTSTAGSEDFLPLVKAGQKGDILITHDPYLGYVKDADAYMDSVEVGRMIPVLAVAPGNPKKIQSIDDLAMDGLKVALTDPKYSTCGEMVYALLEKKGIKDKVLKNVENRLTKGHGNLGTLMQTKAVDAVIMWKGVAHTYKEYLEIVPTPYEYDTVIGVHIIGLNYSKNRELTERFMAFAKQHAKDIFASYGYIE